MDNSSSALTATTIRGTFWTYASYYSGRLAALLSTILLARLLTQQDFGVAGYALVAINFLDVVSDLGIGSAVVYLRDDPQALDTAFWLCVAAGVVLCGVGWFVAPWVGAFYRDERAIPVMRALALSFPVSALGNIHMSLLVKNLAFGRKFIPNLARALGKGTTSIGLALLGFGAWSLILGQLAGAVLAVIVSWWVVAWRPAFRFDVTKVRPLLSYGLRMISTGLLTTFGGNVDYLCVGRFLGASALGVYTLAFRIPELLVLQFCAVVGDVMFPVYTKLRDAPHMLAQGYLTTTRYVTAITLPMALGLVLLAEPLVLTVFGARWAEAVPVLRAIAVYALVISLAYGAGNVYKAQGRPEILTFTTIFQLALLVPALWWVTTTYGSIAAVGWTMALVTLLEQILQIVVAARLLKVPLLSILDAFRPAVIGGAIMVMLAWASLQMLGAAPHPVQLTTGVVVGVLAYGAALWWLQRDVVSTAHVALRAALVRR